MNKRDILLQQMGITQWQLHRPFALKGLGKITLNASTRLVLITEFTLNTNETLITDLLRSLQLSNEQLIAINFEQAKQLTVERTSNHPIYYGLFTDDMALVEKTKPFCHNLNALWQLQDWDTFKHSAQLKRAFWTNIQPNLDGLQ